MPNLNIKKILFSTLIIAFASFFAYGIFNSFEPYEELKDGGYQAEAVSNPFLAAQKYLHAQGINVDETTESFNAQSLENYGTLFISGSSNIISPEQLSTLIDWVNRGGLLIVSADTNDDYTKDFFLDYLQISSSFEDVDEDADTSTNHSPSDTKKEYCLDQNTSDTQINGQKYNDGNSNPASTCIDPKLSELVFDVVENEERALQLQFYYKLNLDHPDMYESSDSDNENNSHDWILEYYPSNRKYGTHFMQFSLGNGRINVVSDDDIWRNKNIASFDHAYLLNMLINEHSAALFIHRINLPPLSELLASYAREAFFAGFILLLLWGARNAQRMGKVIHYSNTTRRSLAEHIAVSGQYLWNGDWQQSLISPLRDEIHRKARLSITRYQQAEAKQQFQFLSEHSGLTYNIVEYTMIANIKHSEDEFFNAVQSLQKIRESL